MAYISADNLQYYHTGLQTKMSNEFYNKTEVDAKIASAGQITFVIEGVTYTVDVTSGVTITFIDGNQEAY